MAIELLASASIMQITLKECVTRLINSGPLNGERSCYSPNLLITTQLGFFKSMKLQPNGFQDTFQV